MLMGLICFQSMTRFTSAAAVASHTVGRGQGEGDVSG